MELNIADNIKTIAIIFGLMTLVLNFYVGYLYAKLNRADIITTYKRISWKILKSALLKTETQNEKDQIVKCFNAYKILLVFFYFELLLILTTVFLSADT